MPVSFLQLFKRRVLPIAFICGMAVLIQKTCNGQTRTHATIVLDLGAAASTVRSIDAELVVSSDSNAQFHRKALPELAIGPCQFEVSMPADDGELTIDVDLGTTKKHLVRRIHASDGATIQIPLGPELTN